MEKKEVNIKFLQKNLDQVLDFIEHGDEIVITRRDVPIAKISPMEKKNFNIGRDFLSQKSIETERSPFTETPEIWFG